MSFWRAETLRARLDEFIVNGDPKHVSHSSYELGVGTEAYITSNPPTKTSIPSDEKLVIPPGQFGIIVTNEVVKISTKLIGFISIKAKIKFQGLINVSGFHVDPGYHGNLKCAVYNAGSRPIVLERNERAFLLWIADLDEETFLGREGFEEGSDRITSENVAAIQGDVASPGQLKKDFTDLKVDITNRVATIETRQTILITLFVGLLLATLGILGKAGVDIYTGALKGNANQTTNSAASGSAS